MPMPAPPAVRLMAGGRRIRTLGRRRAWWVRRAASWMLKLWRTLCFDRCVLDGICMRG
jgi:hypothetical protein